MTPLVSIITPSYNKPQYVGEAIQSVLRQTYPHWQHWIIDNSTDSITRPLLRKIAKTDPRIKLIEIDFTKKQRESFYVTAYLLNQVYPLMAGKYLLYISDDDLLLSLCLQISVDFLEANPPIKVCYHAQELHIINHHGTQMLGGIHLKGVLGGRTKKTVNSNLDGGQILFHTRCLQEIDQPYYPESLAHASTCDGLFMEKLAAKWEFHPVPYEKPLSVHRRTSLSTFIKS